MRRILLGLFVLLTLVSLGVRPIRHAYAMPEGDGWAWVTRVVDGDTIDVVTEDGDAFRVRLIGVDTPETVDPNRPVQCFGPEASRRTKEYVDGRWVWLERDVSQTDRYGRALRYVYTEDGYNLNAQLVYEGYARVATFPPDVRYVDWFLDLERTARENGSGLWGSCPVSGSSAAPVTSSSSTTTAPSSTASSARSNCDPSYPDVCIPSPPPDLDCGDISYRRFRVLPPDPHRFDGDHDGIGCES